MTPMVSKNTTVSTDPNKQPHILINLDIVFPNMPCYLIEADLSTSVNHMESDELEKMMKMTHIKKNGAPDIRQEDVFKSINLDDETSADKIKEFYDGEYECLIKGNIESSKVAGQLVFKTKHDKPAVKKFKEKFPDIQMQMNHRVLSTSFGNERDQSKIMRHFGDIDFGTHTRFNLFSGERGVQNKDSEDKAQHYFYFFKLVPHQFVDYIRGIQISGYSYSLSSNQKEAENPGEVKLTMILDYAPVKMILSREQRPLG